MKKKLQFKELRSLDSAIEQLQGVVDGLRSGVLRLGRGGQELLLEPGAVLDLALHAAREGTRERLELVLEWRRQDSTVGAGLAGSSQQRTAAVPASASRGLAFQAEAERLFDEDDSDGPLSSDDDHTLAPDDVDEPAMARASMMVRAEPARAKAPGVLPGQDELEKIEAEELDDEAITVRHGAPPAGEVASPRPLHGDAEWFQRLYAEARAPGSDGQLHLDEQRFVAALASAGLEPELQEELCRLARQADADGRERLFLERSISELIATTLSGAA